MLRQAKVVAVHPESHSVDLVLFYNGARLSNVQVLGHGGSTNTGHSALPTPTPPATPYSAVETDDRDIYAVVDYMDGVPIVVGFRFPEVCQLLFAQADRKIDRHASDVYTSVDAAGNVEVYHPSGTYFRIGTSGTHEDLTGQDFDKKWKITKNTGAAVHVHLTVANGGSPVASIDIDPSGNIVSSATSWAHTGSITVTGNVTASGTVTGQTDVIAGTISGKTHVHGGVTAGSSNTAVPH